MLCDVHITLKESTVPRSPCETCVNGKVYIKVSDMHFILLRKMKARLPNDDVSRSNTTSIDFC